MMKKRLMLALTLILCAAVLCACGSSQPQTKYQVVGTNVPAQATQNLNMGPTAVPAQDMADDMLAEEDEGDDGDFVIPDPTAVPVTPAPTVRGVYAGATPVIIDPIDKPTPSPVPPINFTYQTYDATNIHLTFEAPAGWAISEPGADSFMLTNTSTAANYAASLTITATSVNSNYSESELKSVVKSLLEQIGEGGFNEFERSNTANRTLLDTKGVYANYTGTLDGDVEVAGRVHVTCLNKVLYTVHITYPRAYTDTYKEKVYDKLRDTIMVSR